MAAKLPKLGSTLHLTLKRAHLLPLVYPVISRQTNSSSQPNTRMEIPSHRSRWYSFTTILFAAGVGATAYGLYVLFFARFKHAIVTVKKDTVSMIC